MNEIISNIKIFLEPTKENRKIVLRLLFIEFIGVLCFLLINIFFQKFLQTIEFKESIQNILMYGSIIIFIVIFMFIIRLFTYKLDPKNFSSFKKYLYRKYLNKYILLNNQEVYKYGTGKFISLINSGIDHRVEALAIGLFDMMRYIVGFLFNLIFIAYIDPTLTIPVLVFSIFIFLWMYKVGKRTYPHRKEITNIEDNISKQTVLMIMEKFTILKNNKLVKEQNKLQSLLSKLEFHSVKSYFYNNLLYNGSQTIVDLSKIFLILFIGIQTFYRNGSIADIATVILVSNFLSNYVQNFTYSYKEISGHIVRLFKLVRLFEDIPTIKKYNQGKNFNFIVGDIEFIGVDFSYSDNKNIFNKFNLKIYGGKKTAIIGKSGIGKTTILKLIMGFVESKNGKIKIDGQDIEYVSLKSYYKYIGYLSQEPPIFDGSVLENITYGIDYNISKDKLKKIIKLSECEFIYGLENGLDTQIGEKGIMLSGGERQRLAIARLFLQDPKILILDEPTSSLDIDSETKINKALHNLFISRTVITVAHKLDTIKDFDDIILLGKNRIIDRGNIKYLSNKFGEFKQFFI